VEKYTKFKKSNENEAECQVPGSGEEGGVLKYEDWDSTIPFRFHSERQWDNS